MNGLLRIIVMMKMFFKIYICETGMIVDTEETFEKTAHSQYYAHLSFIGYRYADY